MLWVLLLIPWLLAGLVMPFLPRRRPLLRNSPPIMGDTAPLVSVIVPARDEAANIAACMSTILASGYPRFELIVVDDQSVDGTLDIARALARLSPVPVRVLAGEPLPDGWVGKPWACWQGVRYARGGLLAFTDADTRHDDALLAHAVGALEESGTDLLSLAPRQCMGGFWERLLQPHVLALLWLRWRDPAAMRHVRNPRHALAGGQFMLIRREAYEAIGGHAGVRDRIAEDVALGQGMVAAGRRIHLALAEDLIETRMYTSFREIVAGWSKNLAAGARMASPRFLALAMPWVAAAAILALWVLPPVVLLLATLFPSMLGDPAGTIRWAGGATAAGLFFWIVLRARYRAYPHYALLYPVGATIVAWLFLRSGRLGRRVSWKGRAYSPERPGAVRTHQP